MNRFQSLPESQRELIDQVLSALWSEAGLGKNTLDAYRSDLAALSLWLLAQQSDLLTVDEALLYRFLAQRHNDHGRRSNARLLSALRRFYAWLVQHGRLAQDPTARLQSAKPGRPLPKTPTESEVEALINAPDLGDARGLRDRAMLELMYATGLRVSELVGLQASGINLRQGVLRVTGKGSRERLVPVGDEALHWLVRYLHQARPGLLRGQVSEVLFPGNRGTAMTRQGFWQKVRQYALQAGLIRPLSPHSLRHGFATHLLNHGVDLRALQMLLGHSSLSTTQIYTLVARERLQSLHRSHHPRG